MRLLRSGPRRRLRGLQLRACATALVFLASGTATPMPAAAQAGPTTNWGYGFQVQLWHLSQDAKTQIVGEVKQAGFNWITHQVEWNAVETAPGQFDWTEPDSIVNTASNAGLKIMLSVERAPAFYVADPTGLMPADPSTFGTFMQTMASRYAGRVQAYELWNEENLAREAGASNLDPATYLLLLEAGYTGMKAGDPGALGLLGAPSPTGANIDGVSIDDITYLQNLYAINNGEVAGYFDAMSAHPSGFSNPPDCTPDTPECSLSGGWNTDESFFAFTRLGQYYDVMNQNGDGGKTIWLTEFGYCSNPSPPPGYEYCSSVSEDTQARYLVQAFQTARQMPYVTAMFQFNLDFQVAVPPTDEKWGFGILRSDWSGRPAYYALAQMPKV
jgi:polysaccharide biosynthesis protein PslG